MIRLLESGQKFPDPRNTNQYDTLAYSLIEELTPERMIEAYPQGIFPYYAYKEFLVRWCAPKKRYVIFPDEIHISHSMRNLMNKNQYRCTIDTNFEEVIWSCAKVDGRIYEEGAWLGPDLIKVWIELHERGYAKSVEVWNNDNELVGGLYGFAHGGCFMGDSMFSKEKNASKLALIHLARHMSAEGGTFIDCQYQTSHLDTMGGREISYDKYLELTEDPKPINWQNMTEYPKDPAMLMSWTNLKLRDYYGSLEELCEDLEIDRKELEDTLNKAGFEYNAELNKFWQNKFVSH